MKIHEICKKKRESQDMTQSELASLIGIRRATISDFENGKYGLGSDTLDKIIEVLGIELKY